MSKISIPINIEFDTDNLDSNVNHINNINILEKYNRISIGMGDAGYIRKNGKWKRNMTRIEDIPEVYLLEYTDDEMLWEIMHNYKNNDIILSYDDIDKDAQFLHLQTRKFLKDVIRIEIAFSIFYSWDKDKEVWKLSKDSDSELIQKYNLNEEYNSYQMVTKLMSEFVGRTLVDFVKEKSPVEELLTHRKENEYVIDTDTIIERNGKRYGVFGIYIPDKNDF